jgi:Fe(3+) dicitrate transport protein
MEAGMQSSACCVEAHNPSPTFESQLARKDGFRIRLVILTLAFTLAGIAQAFAQGDGSALPVETRPTINYHISSQPLNTALRDFALASGLQISFHDDVAAGWTSREVAGSYTPEEALSELLAETGLSFRFISADTVTLERAGPSMIPIAPAARSQNPASIPNNGHATASAGPKPVKVPEIVVKDVHERDELGQVNVEEIPGVVNVITREEIERTRPKNADEMLRRIPGVNIQEEYGQGLRPNIGLRGLNPSRSQNVLLLVDEIPIQPALFGDPSAYYIVPIERVERIEVVKGGASVRYSPNTQGGMINFVTKSIPIRPTFSQMNTFGSFNLFQNSTTYGGRFGNMGAMMGYVRRQSDGFREHSASQLDDFTFRIEGNPDQRTRIVANVNWYNETSQTPGAITPAQFAADRTRAGKLLDEFKGQRGAIDLTATHEFDNHNTSKIIIYGNVFERNWYIQDQNSATGALLQSSTNFLRKFNMFGVVPQHQFTYGLFGQQHKLIVGMRYHVERLTNTTGIGTAGSKISRTTNNADLEAIAYSAYIENEIRLSDRLTLTPGFRWEQVDQSRETMNAIPPATVPNIRGSSTTQGLIYGTGVKYELAGDTMLFGHVHTTFRPPTFSDAVDPTSGTDRDLAAEEGLSSDIGVRTKVLPGVSGELAAFRMEFSNQIVQEGSRLVNAGKTLHEGIESSLLVEWGEIAKPLQGFVTRGNVTLLRGKSLSGITDGKDLPLAPRMLLYGSVGYFHGSGASIEIDAIYVARQFSDLNNTTPENALGSVGVIPSYTLCNLRLNYAPPNARWAVFAGIRNLFDESFIAQRTTGSFVGIQPGEIRNVYGGVSWRF